MMCELVCEVLECGQYCFGDIGGFIVVVEFYWFDVVGIGLVYCLFDCFVGFGCVFDVMFVGELIQYYCC